MESLNYSYAVDGNVVSIDDSEDAESVFVSINQVMIEIESEIGSLAHKHILYLGYDGQWDLLMPEAGGNWENMDIYPLGATTLAGAKVQLRQLVESGKVLSASL